MPAQASWQGCCWGECRCMGGSCGSQARAAFALAAFQRPASPQCPQFPWPAVTADPPKIFGDADCPSKLFKSPSTAVHLLLSHVKLK